MPNGLALDLPASKLYWADARLDKIEVCGLDGSNCQALAKSLAVHPFDLAVYKDYLFFTDWVLQAVVRIDKLSGDYSSSSSGRGQFPSSVLSFNLANLVQLPTKAKFSW